MFSKIATAQAILRRLHEKNAMPFPVMAGAGIAAGAHMTSKSLQKAKEYHAGFTPGYNPHGAQNE